MEFSRILHIFDFVVIVSLVRLRSETEQEDTHARQKKNEFLCFVLAKSYLCSEKAAIKRVKSRTDERASAE